VDENRKFLLRKGKIEKILENLKQEGNASMPQRDGHPWMHEWMEPLELLKWIELTEPLEWLEWRQWMESMDLWMR